MTNIAWSFLWTAKSNLQWSQFWRLAIRMNKGSDVGMEFCLRDVPHPGEFIREELEARGWLQRDLAYILGVPEQAVNMILAGKRGISPDMAKALGDAFDVHPEFFANLQKSFEMANASNAGNRLLATVYNSPPMSKCTTT